MADRCTIGVGGHVRHVVGGVWLEVGVSMGHCFVEAIDIVACLDCLALQDWLGFLVAPLHAREEYEGDHDALEEDDHAPSAPH